MNNVTSFPCLENENYDALAHVGFSLLALSYLMKNDIHLRTCLACSSVILASWGALSLPRASCITTLAWNGLFGVINAAYACRSRARESP